MGDSVTGEKPIGTQVGGWQKAYELLFMLYCKVIVTEITTGKIGSMEMSLRCSSTLGSI